MSNFNVSTYQSITSGSNYSNFNAVPTQAPFIPSANPDSTGGHSSTSSNTVTPNAATQQAGTNDVNPSPSNKDISTAKRKKQARCGTIINGNRNTPKEVGVLLRFPCLLSHVNQFFTPFKRLTRCTCWLPCGV